MTTEAWKLFSDSIYAAVAQAEPLYACAAFALPYVKTAGIDLQARALWLPDAPEILLQAMRKVGIRLCDTDSEDDCAIIKCAEGQTGRFSRNFGDFFNRAQAMLGGPNAATTTLVGAGLGGLGGHVLGRTLDAALPAGLGAILPDEYRREVERMRLTPLLTTAGAGLGAVPGLLRGTVALHNGKSPLSAYPWTKVSAQFDAAVNETGGMFVPTIPVDAFNKAVWSDVHGPANPFGTKSRWGDNDQQMVTPPSAAMLASGLVTAAGAAKGQAWVSPWDVAQVAARIAQGGLVGAATGMIVGRTLGALAGMSPEMQNQAKRTGLWAGALTGVAKTLF